MTKINCIIIDDDIMAVENLSAMLNKNPTINILATSCTFDDAKIKIEYHKPDLIFLDINLGDKTGFQLLDICTKTYQYVIFTTGYIEHTLESFNYDTIHYLLKPINITQLNEAVSKAMNFVFPELRNTGIPETLKAAKIVNGMMFVPENNIWHSINIDEIVYMEADTSYTNIYMFDKKQYCLSKRMKLLEATFSRHIQFVRVHKSFIVNLKYLIAIKKGVKSSLSLMRYDLQIPISTQRKKDIFDYILKKY